MNHKKQEQAKRRRNPAKYWQKWEIEEINKRSKDIELLFRPMFEEEDDQ